MKHFIQAILPLRSVIVTLRWLHDSQPGVMHHAALHAWVRHLSGSAESFSHQVIVEPLENHHERYKKGDLYRFRLTFLKNSETLAHTLLSALHKLPTIPSETRQPGPFGDNLVLENLHDAFTDADIQSLANLSLYDADSLARETAHWSNATAFKLAFITPARLVRLKTDRPTRNKGSQRYCHDKADLTWPLFSQRLMDTVIHLYEQDTGERLHRLDWPEAQLNSYQADWIKQGYRNTTHLKQRQANTASIKDLSGIMAQLRITLPSHFPQEHLALIVLGQYIGIGQSRAFGLGLYRLHYDQSFGQTAADVKLDYACMG